MRRPTRRSSRNVIRALNWLFRYMDREWDDVTTDT
jgi:hypothetical protein